MDIIAKIASAALISIFLQNSIFERSLGSNVLLYASRKKESMFGFALGITYITTLSSIIMYFWDLLFADFSEYRLIMPLIYVATVSIIYVLSLLLIWRVMPKVFGAIKKYVHLTVFNCAVLGALFLSNVYYSDLPSYIGYGFGTGVGFLLAAALLYFGNKRLNSNLVPAAFRGMPIMIVYVGVLSLAFYAFVGYSTSV